MKKGFVAGIEEETRKNSDFRRVLYTASHLQLVLMRLKPGEEIGEEVHDDVDQFFRFEAGTGTIVIDGVKHAVKDGSAAIVPCGARHNVINTAETADLMLYTVYAPPEHRDTVVRKTQREAEASPEEYDGRPTESRPEGIPAKTARPASDPIRPGGGAIGAPRPRGSAGAGQARRATLRPRGGGCGTNPTISSTI